MCRLVNACKCILNSRTIKVIILNIDIILWYQIKLRLNLENVL